MDLIQLEALPLPWQNKKEWFTYLEFIEAYFRNRGIEHPIVVEIGVAGGESRAFYEGLIGAEYIGIDISDAKCKPDILGSSHEKSTFNALIGRLVTRPVDLLFIDGNHVYQFVRRDFEMYAPLVGPGGIVAFHDIMLEQEAGVPAVNALWNEILTHHRRELSYMTFYDLRGESLKEPQMGIGLLIKK